MANIELDGTNKKIVVDSGDLTLDIPGDIILDADGANVTFKDGGTSFLDVSNSSTDAVVTVSTQDKDLIIKGDDGGSAITALTVDMSAAGQFHFKDGTAALPIISNAGDTDTGLLFSAANKMQFSSGGTAQVTFEDGAIVPVTDNDIDLGTSSLEFKNIYVDGTVRTDAIDFGTTTMTLPSDDGSAGQFIKTDGSGTLSFAGAGIDHADQWRLTGAVTGAHAHITGTWERVDTYNFPTDPLGSGVSESSGVFTFPSTGIWYVTFDATCYSGSDGYGGIQIFNTDGQNMAQQYIGFVGNTDEDNTGHCAILIQVDNTGADQVRFHTATNLSSNFNVRGDTNTNYTYVTFIKLSSSTS